MIALIKDETIAIKTANGSAVKLKLNPNCKGLKILTTFPFTAAGKSADADTKAASANNNANTLRALRLTFPITGKAKASAKGAKTADKIKF